VTARAIGTAGKGLKRLFDSSSVWCFVKSGERTSVFLEKSFFFNAVRKVLETLLFLLRRLYSLAYPVMRDSLFCSAAFRVVEP